MTRDEQKQRRLAIALHAARHGGTAAAKRYDVSEVTVSRARQEFGLRDIPTPESVELVLRLFLGSSHQRLAEDYGATPQRLSFFDLLVSQAAERIGKQ